MKTREKAKVTFNGKRGFLPMSITVPNKRGAALDQRGFTLVELIVVCAVIGVLVAMAIPSYNTMSNKAKIARAKEEIRSVEKSILAYQADQGNLPNSLADIKQHLEDLRDPWGNTYEYHKKTAPDFDGGAYLDASGGHDLNTDFDLYSKGLDGGTDKDISMDAPSKSLDDIVRGGTGSYVDAGINLNGP